MVYGGSSDGNDDGIAGGGVGSEEMWGDRVELVLVLLSNLYLSSNSILVGVSGPSSCTTWYCLLTTYTTNYYFNQNIQTIRKYCSTELLYKNLQVYYSILYN